MRKIGFLLLITSLFSQEVALNEFPLDWATPASVLPVEYKQKNLFYGAASILSGVGLSQRTREEKKGTSLDVKAGVLFLEHRWPGISVAYNWMTYRKETLRSPYISWGLGAYYIVPYIPLRVGMEFEKGFVDLGVDLVVGVLPIPELRGGISF